MNSRQPISEPAARRVYRSRLRAEQAGETRRRLLTAAGACFAERGYAGTSLKAIAERAGVSVETVQLNGPKADLLLAAYEQSFVGEEGRRSLLERDSVQPILELTDPSEMIAGMVDFLASANATSAALAAAFEAAALSDPKIDEVLKGLTERAREDARAATRLVAARGGVSSGRSLDEVGDELWFLARPPHYLTLVQQAGWSFEHYHAWLSRSVRSLLL
jgi:AcrR family transcriptional regulator